MKRTNTAKWVEKSQRWQINVQKDGIRKTFVSSAPGRTGQREANRKADQWLDDCVEDTKIKVKDAYAKFIDELKITTSQSNWLQYDSYFRVWIIPNVGAVRVERLSEQMIQDIINKAYSKGLSQKTLKNIRACMFSFLKYCRKCKYTSLLPENITIPKGATVGKRTILQPSDLKVLFSEDTTLLRGEEIHDPFIYAYRFHVMTGLRPGELIGLHQADIKDGTVYLKRSINALGEVTTGKNENAQRDFALNIFTSSIIAQQLSYLEENDVKSDFLFCRLDGEPIGDVYYNKRFAKYCEYHDLPKVTPYELRHTFVSAVKTLPEGYLKSLVGHSKDMDTYGVYGHQMTGEKQEAASLIQEIFKSILAG